MSRLFLFDTTTHVLWAEEVAGEAGIPVDVVPAPSDSRGKCGLALRTLEDAAGRLKSLLEEEGIPFQEHTRR